MSLRTTALEGLADHAKWVVISSQRIVDYILMLQSRPPYDTHAEAALKEAAEAIVQAHIKVLEAIEIWHKLKLESEQ